MNQQQRQQLFKVLASATPNPTTELKYNSNFELLIAVILSAQATDVGVNKATIKLFAVANSPEAILTLGLDKLKQAIKTIGLFNTKASNIIKTCEILIQQHKSQVPNSRADLQKLAGVGRKTANVILNTAFGQPVIAVDTHIFRVSNRTKLAIGKDVLAVETKLDKVVPDKYKLNAHHWLILHGRYTCIARKPKCGICIIFEVCEFKTKHNYC